MIHPKSIYVVIVSATFCLAQVCHAQTYSNLSGAQTFLKTKIGAVGNPGRNYKQTLTFNAGEAVLEASYTDAKAAETKLGTICFSVEHIDKDRILQIVKSSELKLTVPATRRQPLFRLVKDNKTVYVSAFSIYCNDIEMAREVKDALAYIVTNTPASKPTVTTSDKGYDWLTQSLSKSFEVNGIRYEGSLNVDKANNNKLTYSLTSTEPKRVTKRKYEFYLKDFNGASFRVTVASGNLLGLEWYSTSGVKAVSYFENDIQKSYINRFHIALDGAKLSTDALSVLEKMATGNFK